MKYYIISGEASGDLHASNLMKALKVEDKSADFRFWGGDLMLKEGGFMVKHFKDTAFMGFVDVAVHIREIKKNFALCKRDLLEYKPDLLILVDYPGFNLRIAEFAHQNLITTHYYISPKIWAWKQSRVHKIKKFIDKMFVIFPFEIDFYNKFDYPVSYVGNPLLDAIRTYNEFSATDEAFRSKNGLSDKPLIALLPGSRKQEIKNHLSLMLDLADLFPDYEFVVAGAPALDEKNYKKYFGTRKVKILYNTTYDILKFSVAGVITSGTATLEAALFNLPQFVCYRGEHISYQIAKRLVKVKYISLVNLVMDKELVKEYIQYDMTLSKMKEELEKLLFDAKYRGNMLTEYSKLQDVLGGSGASLRTAEEMVKSIS